MLGERPFKRVGEGLRNIDRYRLGISSVAPAVGEAAAAPQPPPPPPPAAEEQTEPEGGPPLPVAG